MTTACLPKVLATAGHHAGRSPRSEDRLKRKLLDQVLPTTKVKLIAADLGADLERRPPQGRGEEVHRPGERRARHHVRPRPRAAQGAGRRLPGAAAGRLEGGPDRRPDPHPRLPGRGALPRAPEQVGLRRGLGDQRRRLGLQAGRGQPAGDPDRRPRHVGQLRRTGGELQGRRGRRAHVRVASPRARRARWCRASTSSSPSEAVRDFLKDTDVRARRQEPLQHGVVRRAFAPSSATTGRAPSRLFQQADRHPAEPARRQADADRGAGEGEEPAAAAVPVGLGGARRDRAQRGRLRPPVPPALAEATGIASSRTR